MTALNNFKRIFLFLFSNWFIPSSSSPSFFLFSFLKDFSPLLSDIYFPFLLLHFISFFFFARDSISEGSDVRESVRCNRVVNWIEKIISQRLIRVLTAEVALNELADCFGDFFFSPFFGGKIWNRSFHFFVCVYVCVCVCVCVCVTWILPPSLFHFFFRWIISRLAPVGKVFARLPVFQLMKRVGGGGRGGGGGGGGTNDLISG